MEIKLSDIIPYNTDTDSSMTEQINVLQGLLARYENPNTNIHELEDIKRRMTAALAYISTLQAKWKRYKGANHTYMEDERKALKARIIKRMMSDGDSFNKAESLVYDDEEFKAFMAVINKRKMMFISFESVFDIYQSVLQSIVQSVSVMNKEKSNYQNE